MTDREFASEVVERLLPGTQWHGDSYLDNKSLDNLDVLKDILELVVDELTWDSIVPEGNKGNASYMAIAKKKQKVISWAMEKLVNYSLEYDLKKHDDD